MASSETGEALLKEFGDNKFFGGVHKRGAHTIYELSDSIVERFMAQLVPQEAEQEDVYRYFYMGMKPIADGVVAEIEQRKQDRRIRLLCRKGSPKNCSGRVSAIGANGLLNDDDSVSYGIPVQVGCNKALTGQAGKQAAVVVEGAEVGLFLDSGCYGQITAMAELAAGLMLERLLELEERAESLTL